MLCYRCNMMYKHVSVLCVFRLWWTSVPSSPLRLSFGDFGVQVLVVAGASRWGCASSE